MILTDGYNLYIRLRRGVYAQVDRQGRRLGRICSGFTPRPRWRPAKLCSYDQTTTLTCPHCGYYDTHYAQTGERSFCANQRKQT